MKYLRSYPLFESRSNPKIDLLSQLPWDYLESYYKEEHPRSTDFDEMCLYLGNLWSYVDDESFLKDHIEGEIEYYQSDWEYHFNHKSEVDEYLIPYIMRRYDAMKDKQRQEAYRQAWIEKVVEKSYDAGDEEYVEEIASYQDWEAQEILDELDHEEIKEILEEVSDTYDFLKEYWHQIYRNSSAEDIAREYYGKAEVESYEFFTKNNMDIQNYMDEEAMKKDLDEDLDENTVYDALEDDLTRDEALQRKVFTLNPANSYLMMEEDVASEIADEYDFQEAYLREATLKIKEENQTIATETNTEPEDYLEELWGKVKEHFIDAGYSLDPALATAYGLEPYIEGEEMGFFLKN